MGWRRDGRLYEMGIRILNLGLDGMEKIDLETVDGIMIVLKHRMSLGCYNLAIERISYTHIT